MSLDTTVMNLGSYTREYFDQDDICRLCFCRNADSELFTKTDTNCIGVKKEILHLIVDCVGLELSDTFGPKKVCKECSTQIELFYKFKQFCRQTDRRLREVFSNSLNVVTVQLETRPDIKVECYDEDFEDSTPLNTFVGKSSAEEKKSDHDDNNVFLDNPEVRRRPVRKKPSKQNTNKSNSCLKCFGCDLVFRNYHSRAEHELRTCEQLRKGYKCPTCGRYLPNRRLYSNHMKNHEIQLIDEILNAESLSTPTSTSASASVTALPSPSASTPVATIPATTPSPSDPKPKSPKKKATYCYICHINFDNIQTFEGHNVEAHGISKDGEMKCFGCDKMFKHTNARTAHEKNFCKNLKDGYKCAECDQFLPTRRHYEAHMRSHRDNVPMENPEDLFKCKRCDMSFSTKGMLIDHINQHEGRNFVCESCGRVFTRQDYLNKHMLVHSGLKQHECPECGFRAAQRTTLVIHMRKHTDERPFACQLCPQRCRTSSNLRAHAERHQGVKNFQCTLCGKKFGYKSSLEEHIESNHERTKTYACEQCGATYIRARGLKRHLAAKHSNTKKQDGKDNEDEPKSANANDNMFLNLGEGDKDDFEMKDHEFTL